MKRSHTQLQQQILTTIREATRQAATALAQTVQPMLGDRGDVVDELLGGSDNGQDRPLPRT
jgi:hypothetical protein